MCKALLLFHFDFGDLVRWLGGDYTHDHIDHDSTKEALVALRSVQQGEFYPKQNFDRVFHSFIHGVPDNAAYECTIKDVLARNLYNSHAGSQLYLTSMLSKIADDVNSHFMIAFPRWIWPFLYGLFFSPLGYVQKKGRGRTVVDPTHLVNGDNDTGALNSYLDKSNPLQVPPVFYQSAQIRHWTHIYNMRITHKAEDILLYKDDIQAVFKRTRYHPDISITHAYVCLEWLLIPIGEIFGGRGSAGWFCMQSEVRALAAAHLPTIQHSDIQPLSK